jgi:predicted branched-subunit amino acid permease
MKNSVNAIVFAILPLIVNFKHLMLVPQMNQKIPNKNCWYKIIISKLLELLYQNFTKF